MCHVRKWKNSKPSLPEDWTVRKVEGKLVYRSPQNQILKSNKGLLDYLRNHELSKEDARMIRNFVEEDEKNTKEGQRLLKEMRKQKSEEWAEIVKKYKKRKEDGGEEIIPPLEVEEPMQSIEDQEERMKSVEEEEEVIEPPRKKRKVKKSSEKGECPSCFQKLPINTLLKHAPTCYGPMDKRVQIEEKRHIISRP